MRVKFLAAVLLIASFSCTKTEDMPTPAEAISGLYKAAAYYDIEAIEIKYPINGQTIELRISPVSADKVRVEVNSTVNGFYSPGAAAVYPEVAVTEITCNQCPYGKAFRLQLTPPVNAGTPANTIWFNPEYKAYYSYIPPNFPRGSVQISFVRTAK
jgi:hypothetical protein